MVLQLNKNLRCIKEHIAKNKTNVVGAGPVSARQTKDKNLFKTDGVTMIDNLKNKRKINIKTMLALAIMLIGLIIMQNSVRAGVAMDEDGITWKNERHYSIDDYAKYYYYVDSDEKFACIEEIIPKGEKVEIPDKIKEELQDEINEYQVIRIGQGTVSVFQNDSKMDTIEIVLPEGLKTIASHAFCDCSNLTGELIIPNSVVYIGRSAFSYCSGLTGNLEIPDSVTTIGTDAFSYCSGFKGNLKLSSNLTKIEAFAFAYCGFTGTLEIPSNVTAIGAYAFNGCRGFTGDLRIPNNVAYIGESAFGGCESLEKIILPSVTLVIMINDGAIDPIETPVYAETKSMADAYNTYEEGKWMHVNNGDGVYALQEDILKIDDTKALTTVWQIPSGENVEITLPLSGDNMEFIVDWGDGNIETITNSFPTHEYSSGEYKIMVQYVSGDNIVWGYQGSEKPGEGTDYYTYTKYLKKLTNWGEINATGYGFAYCEKLEEVSGNASENSFNKLNNMCRMFAYSKKLKTINLENINTSNVTDMLGMFWYCESLEELDLSDFDTSQVTTMQSMFRNASKLKKVDLSSFDTSNVTNMDRMFSICKALKTLDVRNFNTQKVTNMQAMFQSCTELKNLNLESFNTSSIKLMDIMFKGSSNLNSILIGEKFVSNGNYTNMFDGCTNLTKIIAVSKMPVAQQFKGVIKGNINLYVPNESLESYISTLSGDTNKENIKPVVEPSGESQTYLLKGNIYKEKGATIAGFSEEDYNSYNVYGYFLETSGDVDVNNIGEYKIEYILTRNYKNKAGEILESKSTAIRTVNVRTSSIVTLYKNNEIYDGNWTNQNVIALVKPLSNNTTSLAVKLENTDWNLAPSYAEISKSGDEFVVIFNRTIDITAYIREIGVDGKATTMASDPFSIKIDKEEPVIEEITTKTEDGIMKLRAKVNDELSGVSYYSVVQGIEYPTSWNVYNNEVNEILEELLEDGTYYLWVKDEAGNETRSESLLAKKDREAPKGIIEIIPTNIVSGDKYNEIIIVDGEKVSGEKYTNKEIVEVKLYATDNQSKLEDIKYEIFNEVDYKKAKEGNLEINWKPYVESTNFTLNNIDGKQIIYVVLKDAAGNETLVIENLINVVVTFDPTGGTLDVLEKTVVYGDKYGELPIPEKEGYKFVGWFTKKVSGEQIKETTTVNTMVDQTLYAEWEELEAIAIYTRGNNTLTFLKPSGEIKSGDTYSGEKVTKVYTGIEKEIYIDLKNVPWQEYSGEITKVVVANKVTPKSTRRWFDRLGMLESVELGNLDTSEVETMYAMFQLCSKIDTIDVSNWNTEKVTDMNCIFNQCTNIVSLDVSNWETGNVTDMAGMFNQCYNLTSLDVSNFNTEKVTDMNDMFRKCSNITKLDLSNWNTQNVIDAGNMFNGMNKLQEIKLGANFKFLSTATTPATGSLPTPSSSFITGADEHWYNSINGYRYTAEDIANGVKLSGDTTSGTITYIAVDPRVKVNFDANGGQIVGVNAGTKIIKAMVGRTYGEAGSGLGLPEAIWEGHEFLGWFTSGDTEVQITNETTVTEDVLELVARWEERTQITIYLDVEEDVILHCDETIRLPIGDYIGDYLYIGEAEKKGYYLEGWYTASGEKIEYARVIDESLDGITLYAKWKKLNVEIYLDVEEDVILHCDNPLVVPINGYQGEPIGEHLYTGQAQKEDYYLEGWYTASGEKIEYDRVIDESLDGITLHPGWKKYSSFICTYVEYCEGPDFCTECSEGVWCTAQSNIDCPSCDNGIITYPAHVTTTDSSISGPSTCSKHSGQADTKVTVKTTYCINCKQAECEEIICECGEILSEVSIPLTGTCSINCENCNGGYIYTCEHGCSGPHYLPAEDCAVCGGGMKTCIHGATTAHYYCNEHGYQILYEGSTH